MIAMQVVDSFQLTLRKTVLSVLRRVELWTVAVRLAPGGRRGCCAVNPSPGRQPVGDAQITTGEFGKMGVRLLGRLWQGFASKPPIAAIGSDTLT